MRRVMSWRSAAKGIALRAGNSRGWIYAVQTLRPDPSQEGLSLPCLLIEDYPSLEIRGFMHDVTRSRVPSMESMKAPGGLVQPV